MGQGGSAQDTSFLEPSSLGWSQVCITFPPKLTNFLLCRFRFSGDVKAFSEAGDMAWDAYGDEKRTKNLKFKKNEFINISEANFER